jgi:hypothetical protein
MNTAFLQRQREKQRRMQVAQTEMWNIIKKFAFLLLPKFNWDLSTELSNMHSPCRKLQQRRWSQTSVTIKIACEYIFCVRK